MKWQQKILKRIYEHTSHRQTYKVNQTLADNELDTWTDTDKSLTKYRFTVTPNKQYCQMEHI